MLGLSVVDPGISKTWGRGSCAVEFLGSGIYVDDTFPHKLCFVVRVENKVNIVNNI